MNEYCTLSLAQIRSWGETDYVEGGDLDDVLFAKVLFRDESWCGPISPLVCVPKHITSPESRCGFSNFSAVELFSTRSTWPWVVGIKCETKAFHCVRVEICRSLYLAENSSLNLEAIYLQCLSACRVLTCDLHTKVAVEEASRRQLPRVSLSDRCQCVV
jgi:hypothetical protein